MFETKRHRQNDRTDDRITVCFSLNNEIKLISTSEIHVAHAEPDLLIVCMIDVSLFGNTYT